MPHIVIHYTPNLELKTDMSALCRSLADAMLNLPVEVLSDPSSGGKPIFPVGGTRVFAVPAAHYAVADGKPPADKEYGFVYINLRMAKGRSAAVHTLVGETVAAAVKRHFAPLLAAHLVGVTFQIDEGHEVFDLKYSSLHPYFGS
jgi:5-carboxymethyl-2-hydroxymuconate isomerase